MCGSIDRPGGRFWALKVTFVPKKLLKLIGRLTLLKNLPIWLLGFDRRAKSDTAVHLKLAEAVPDASLTVTVVLKTVLSATVLGTVPEMTPVSGSIDRPVGKPVAEKGARSAATGGLDRERDRVRLEDGLIRRSCDRDVRLCIDGLEIRGAAADLGQDARRDVDRLGAVEHAD